MGAADDDELPHLMAGQTGWVHSTVIAVIGREKVKSREPREVSREVLALFEDIEDLLGGRLLSYAVRTAAWARLPKRQPAPIRKGLARRPQRPQSARASRWEDRRVRRPGRDGCLTL